MKGTAIVSSFENGKYSLFLFDNIFAIQVNGKGDIARFWSVCNYVLIVVHHSTANGALFIVIKMGIKA